MSSRYVWDENGNIDTENVPDPFFDPLKTEHHHGTHHRMTTVQAPRPTPYER